MTIHEDALARETSVRGKRGPGHSSYLLGGDPQTPDDPDGAAPDQAGPTFADVLNGLTFGSRPADQPAHPVKPTPTPRGSTAPPQPQPVLVEMPDDDPAMVRPYAWTGGRTRPENEIRVEAMISTRPDLDEETLTQVEHCSIAQLCRTPRSVAEISAELEIPLQVAKIVLGDMVATGLVIVHRTTGLTGGSSHLALMERVLGGLRRL